MKLLFLKLNFIKRCATKGVNYISIIDILSNNITIYERKKMHWRAEGYIKGMLKGEGLNNFWKG